MCIHSRSGRQHRNRSGSKSTASRTRWTGPTTGGGAPRSTATTAARYGFVVDGETLPDPRSPRQPEGVHLRSQLHQLDEASWTDSQWTGRQLPGSSVYELHIGTFTPEGTFDAAIERLDHLVDLGVGFVEIMPVNGFNGTHNWGYDGVLWYTVHEIYGGPDGLQRLVNAAHERGLGVILDVVYNHLGPSGKLPRKVRPLHCRWSEHLGPNDQHRRPAVGRGSRVHHRQCPAMDA